MDSARITLSPERRELLIDAYHAQADLREQQAELFRRDGDPLHAEELEQVALDYRVRAGELELCSV